jgi:hypothetical protein
VAENERVASSYIATLKALVLIVGPILLGAAWFLAVAPARQPGVYVEYGNGTSLLQPCDPGKSSPLSARAAGVAGAVTSFFVVLPDAIPASSADPSPQLFFTVVNHVLPDTELARIQLDTDVRTMAPNIYRVVSSQKLRWETGGLGESIYRQTLMARSGNRATIELLVELQLPDPTGTGSCRYGVVVGPPPQLPDSSIGWFVPPPGKNQ